jgi:hypothetical protein
LTWPNTLGEPFQDLGVKTRPKASDKRIDESQEKGLNVKYQLTALEMSVTGNMQNRQRTFLSRHSDSTSNAEWLKTDPMLSHHRAGASSSASRTTISSCKNFLPSENLNQA